VKQSRLFERRERGELAVGALVLTPGPDYVELMGHAGLDFVVVQVMTTSIDWAELANFVRAAQRYDVTTIAWLQAYPWGDEVTFDPRLPADVLRAVSIGCHGVFASVNDRRQVEAMVGVSGNSHSRPWIRDLGLANPFPTAGDGQTIGEVFAEQEEQWRARRLVAPLIEDLHALDRIEDMLAVPHLRGFALGMGDLTRELGHPGEYLHPQVQAVVKRAVAVGNQHGLTAIANVGMPMGADSQSAVIEGVQWMWDNGVHCVMIPHPTFAAQWFYENALRGLPASIQKVHPRLER
jgi:2-keto-3-deoxy-L-rhamnonate aldolase RhmA